MAASLLLAGLGLACGSGSEEPPVPAAAPASPDPASPSTAAAGVTVVAAHAEAEEVFATRCFTCHGAAGAGDGPASAGLEPPPRNFQDPAWQSSVSDEHIRQIIQYGGAAVGRSPAMPANPDLASKPEVVEALLAHVRRLAGG